MCICTYICIYVYVYVYICIEYRYWICLLVLLFIVDINHMAVVTHVQNEYDKSNVQYVKNIVAGIISIIVCTIVENK